MPQPYPIWKLARHQSAIAKTNPFSQSINFKIQRWQTQPVLQSNIAALVPHLSGTTITRKDVLQLGILYKKGLLTCEQLFLATMIWGYGTIGYGPWRTAKMFKTPGFSKILSEVCKHLASGNLACAYNRCQIEFCGPHFITKFFYFMGLTYQLHPLPLILDSRVADSLIKCNSSTFAASTYFRTRGAGRYVSGYIEYVSDMNSWAVKQGFAPDKLEMFLFDPPAGF